MIVFPNSLYTPTDSDVLSYILRINSAGGSIKPLTRNALNRFVSYLKSSGIWSKLLRINLFCSDTFTGVLVPLKVETGGANDSNNSFVSGDYSYSSGLQSDGSTKNLNTNALESIFTGSLGGLAFFVGNSISASASNQCLIGSGTGNVPQCSIYISNGTQSLDGRLGGTVQNSLAVDPITGLVAVERTALNRIALYKQGTNIKTVTSTVASTTGVYGLRVFAETNGFDKANALSRGYAFTNGAMTDTDHANLSSAWVAFNTALGRT